MKHKLNKTVTKKVTLDIKDSSKRITITLDKESIKLTVVGYDEPVTVNLYHNDISLLNEALVEVEKYVEDQDTSKMWDGMP